MKRLSKLRLSPLFCLFFLLPVHATENGIIESSLRDQRFAKALKERKEDVGYDCCAPIVHKRSIHPHILDDCRLLVMGYIKRKVSKKIVVPRDIYGLLGRYLAGDLDKNHFDKTCFVHNDTGAFIGWIPKENEDESAYRIKGFETLTCHYPFRVNCSNILACRKFTGRYGRSGRDKSGYSRAGYDIWGYDKNGYDRERYNREGYDREGYDREGYDITGYDRNGYRRDGAGVILDPILMFESDSDYE